MKMNNDLDINASGIFTVNSDVRFTVDDIVNDGGSAGLVLKSDVNGTASLIQTTGAVNATVERYITGDQWHYMYPPLSTITTATYTNEGAQTNDNLYSYLEPNKDYWKPTYIYETTGWTSEVANTNLRTDKGYIYNRYGYPTRTVSQTGGNLFVGQKQFSITYTTNGGTIDATCVQGWNNYDGWNLVGNPYASAINWEEVDKTNIENVVYCYDDTQDKYAYYGTDIYSGSGLTVNSGSQYIPSGQAFMVKKAAVGTDNFTLQSDDREHNAQGFWKGGEKDIIPNLIRLNIEKDGYTDETIIRTLPIESEVTTNHDGQFDAYKMFAWDNYKPQLYSRNHEKTNYFAINSLPEITTITSVLLGLYVGVAGEYTINLTENNFENTHVWLEDKLDNSLTNFNETTTYEFSQGAENNEDRFILHFGLNHAPNTMVSLSNQTIYVDTDFYFELPLNTFYDVDEFDEIAISTNNLPEWLTFENGNLQGTADAVGQYQINFVATDIFGEQAQNGFIINVIKNETDIIDLENNISLYPNPTTGIITVQFTNVIDGNLSVVNIAGQVMTEMNINNKTVELNLSKFAKGVYFINIESETQIYREKIIIE